MFIYFINKIFEKYHFLSKMEDKEKDNKNKKEKKKIKRKKEEIKKPENEEKTDLDDSPKLQCLKIQINSHITEFLYYQRYPKKNNEKYDPKLCALVYYFNENLDDKFFYLYFSLMGQIDEIFFGSFFGHNSKMKLYSKKDDSSPKKIHFAIIKYLEEESLNILLDNKKAQMLINNYLYNERNVKIDLQYDLLEDEKNIGKLDENGEKNKKKNIEEEFVLVKGNTSKNNFSYGGVSFKIGKDKNKDDLDLDEDDENSDMPYLKKKKKKKSLGNDFYYNFQLLNKKRSVKEELEELFAKDKEVIERKKKMKEN